MRTLLIFLFFFIMTSSVANAQLGTMYKNADRFVTGNFSKQTVDTLRAYLQRFSVEKLKDTIIINYNFNKDHCWQMLDEKPKKYINKVIENSKKYVADALLARPYISVFSFREAGDYFSKYKKYDNTILIDSGYLKNDFFTDNAVCGTSLMVFPKGNYLYVRSDPHFEALTFLFNTDGSLKTAQH